MRPIARALLTTAVLLFAASLAAAGVHGGQDESAVDAFARNSAPGPQHEVLSDLEGEFDLTATFWFAPGAAPEVSQLPARRSLALDGRVLRTEVGPDAGGFRGFGWLGYDRSAERYWYTWTDTSTTGLSLLHGAMQMDGSGTFSGETPTPMGSSPLRVEIRREGKTEVHDYFVPGEGGAEYRMLELRYVPSGGS